MQTKGYENKTPRKSSNSVPGVFNPELDWEQSRFCSKIRGKELAQVSSRERAPILAARGVVAHSHVRTLT